MPKPTPKLTLFLYVRPKSFIILVNYVKVLTLITITLLYLSLIKIQVT